MNAETETCGFIYEGPDLAAGLYGGWVHEACEADGNAAPLIVLIAWVYRGLGFNRTIWSTYWAYCPDCHQSGYVERWEWDPPDDCWPDDEDL